MNYLHATISDLLLVIQIGGIQFTEPTTTFSDLFLTILCVCIIRILRKYKKQNSSILYWQIFFLFMAMSTFVGVIVHGMRYYQSDSMHNETWMGMNVLAGLSVYFAQIATTHSVLKESKQKKLLCLIANIQVFAYLIGILLIHSFMVVKIQIAIGMIPVMLINFSDYKKGGRGGAWIGIGIGISFFSAVFHTMKLSLNEDWFNYNDISHIFIGASFVLMSYGISKRMISFRDRSEFVEV